MADQKTASRMVESRWLEASCKCRIADVACAFGGMRGWLVQDKCRDRGSLVAIQRTRIQKMEVDAVRVQLRLEIPAVS